MTRRSLALFLVLLAGCQDEGSSAALPPGPSDGGSADVVGDAAAPCQAATCASLGATCGSAPDGCGGKVQCGTCTDGLRCGGDGPNRCGTANCAPKTCSQLGASCGFVSDGCAVALDCGTCAPPLSCGGGGVEGQCGCERKTCGQLGAECGTVPDGCEGTVSCGACAAGLTCGAGGPNRCGTGSCTPRTCTQQGATCGWLSDGCADVLDCGDCDGFAVCGGGGQLNQCGCTPKTCMQLGFACGVVADACGGSLDCGSCPPGSTCGGSGVPGLCSCSCSLPHATGTCANGGCAVEQCDMGWADCNEVDLDGCETDLSSPSNCGSCGTDCGSMLPNATVSCLDGACSLDGCWGAFGDCDPDEPGCETVTVGDDAHCGECGHACPSGFHCEVSVCRCLDSGSCDTGGGGVCDSPAPGYSENLCHCGTVWCDGPCDAAGTACL